MSDAKKEADFSKEIAENLEPILIASRNTITRILEICEIHTTEQKSWHRRVLETKLQPDKEFSVGDAFNFCTHLFSLLEEICNSETPQINSQARPLSDIIDRAMTVVRAYQAKYNIPVEYSRTDLSKESAASDEQPLGNLTDVKHSICKQILISYAEKVEPIYNSQSNK